MLIGRATVNGESTYGVIEGDSFHVLRKHPFEGIERTGDEKRLDELELEVPIEPFRTFVLGKGFPHPDDAVKPPGAIPRLFSKATSPVSGPEGEIVIPSWATVPIWGECELALVVGQTVHRAGRDEAAQAIFGYACFNDVTSIELWDERTNSNFLLGKSVDTFASMGPWIRTDLSESEIAAGLQLSGRVDGEILSSGTTKDLRFAPSEIVSWASTYITLYPGDVISLGTPGHVDLHVGNVFEIDVEGIGVLRNYCVSDNAP